MSTSGDTQAPPPPASPSASLVWTSWAANAVADGRHMAEARRAQRRNKCTALVAVRDEVKESIDALSAKYSGSCWRYPPNELLVPFYVQRLAAQRRVLTSTADVDTFYALVNHHCSPWQFYVQPKCFERLRARMAQRLDDAYNSGTVPCLDHGELFVGAACVCAVGQQRQQQQHPTNDTGDEQAPPMPTAISWQWHRATVLRVCSGGGSALVRFVDWGDTATVPLEQCTPLLAAFSRCPPLAIHCRMADVDMNDLTSERVADFMRVLHEVGCAARVQLVKVAEPMVVRLWHPTVVDCDLGQPFYRKGAAWPLRNAVARQLVNAYAARRSSSSSTGSATPSSGSSTHGGKYGDVVALERVAKAPRHMAIEVAVTAVHSHTVIFMQTPNQWLRSVAMRRALGEAHAAGQLCRIDADSVHVGLAVAARWPGHGDSGSGAMGPWHRCVVRSCSLHSVRVQSVDGGALSAHIDAQQLEEHVRALPRAFRQPPPLVYAGRLEDFGAEPHESISVELRRLLRAATVDQCSVDCDDDNERLRRVRQRAFGPLQATFYSSAGPPQKVQLVMGGCDVATALHSRVRHMRTACTSLVLQRSPPDSAALLDYMRQASGGYERQLCDAMRRGRLALGSVSADVGNFSAGKFDKDRMGSIVDALKSELGAG